jgi:hypothetical protein
MAADAPPNLVPADGSGTSGTLGPSATDVSTFTAASGSSTPPARSDADVQQAAAAFMTQYKQILGDNNLLSPINVPTVAEVEAAFGPQVQPTAPPSGVVLAPGEMYFPDKSGGLILSPIKAQSDRMDDGTPGGVPAPTLLGGALSYLRTVIHPATGAVYQTMLSPSGQLSLYGPRYVNDSSGQPVLFGALTSKQRGMVQGAVQASGIVVG